MTKVEHLQPESLRDNQSRYSHVVKAGDWVLIAGQGPADVHGNIPN
jgi:enamine deaminase RidA (YjgF/YER057c/UK114 family)